MSQLLSKLNNEQKVVREREEMTCSDRHRHEIQPLIT
jgi:hypothetical protein